MGNNDGYLPLAKRDVPPSEHCPFLVVKCRFLPEKHEATFFSSVPDYDAEFAPFSEHLLKAKLTGRSNKFGEYNRCCPAGVFLESRLSQLDLKITEHKFLEWARAAIPASLGETAHIFAPEIHIFFS